MKTSIQPTEDGQFVLEMTREFSANREAVFAAFGSFEAMATWFGPHHCGVTGGHVDFREGGTYRLEIHSEAQGANVVGGLYREISPPERIVFSWRWEPKESDITAEMEVELSFFENGTESTTLHLRQTKVPDQDTAESHNWGWGETFEKLAALFAD